MTFKKTAPKIFYCVDPFSAGIRAACGLYTSMNQIERNGQVYEYDADFDVYRRQQEPVSLGARYGWLAVCLVLVLTCYFITVLK